MKHVRAVFDLPKERRHPMHQFVVERDGVTDYELVSWTPTPDGSVTLLLRFVGDLEPYRTHIRDTEHTEIARVTDGPGDRVYVYARDPLDGPVGHTVARFVELGLVVVPPVQYRDDGAVAASIVGPGEQAHAAIDAIPDDIDVSVESVRAYGAHATDRAAGLTAPQREAVEAAVECGYYEPTRSGSVDAVGDELGCSASAAAERLRRAEANVMQKLVANGSDQQW
jgi:hypothetical protein